MERFWRFRYLFSCPTVLFSAKKMENAGFDPAASSLLTTCDTNYTNPPILSVSGQTAVIYPGELE